MSDIVEKAVHELTDGQGFIVIEGLYDDATIAAARARISELAGIGGEGIDRGAKARSEADTVLSGQEHVWNLIAKGRVFEEMVQEPTILAIFSRILGSDLKLGSYAARPLYPGGQAQIPHLDYPYWDLYEAETFPMGIDGSFFMNCQVTVMLDDFTAENGATWVAPGTQRRCAWPDPGEFDRLKVQTTGKAGSVMLMTGLLWHGSGENKTDGVRVGLLGQFLPKFVKPMEDQLRSVGPDVVARATPTLRRLLGVDYPYPQVFDAAS
ncbi:MAG: phytanoyl-CoA dioxygenase family protein [Azospirillaceae bacterium]